MSERTVVDFSRVEAALALATRERELASDRVRSENTARLIKHGALGIAIMVVSIGIALWLARATKIVHPPQPQPLPPPTAAPVQWPTPVPNNGPTNKIVTNLSLFNTISRPDLSFFNPYFLSLNAGHRYNNSNAEAWEAAWCYANFEKDLMKFKVDLARRTRTNLTPEIVTQKELRELGLSEADIVFLRGQCPWRG